ncbi:hypothetical protein [Nannocystis pusilla]|uniref:hypothetical protein n=1 Tax=Nannocystis pusilla TaxID=889268 RepID=UPI003B7B226E
MCTAELDAERRRERGDQIGLRLSDLAVGHRHHQHRGDELEAQRRRREPGGELGRGDRLEQVEVAAAAVAEEGVGRPQHRRFTVAERPVDAGDGREGPQTEGELLWIGDEEFHGALLARMGLETK